MKLHCCLEVEWGGEFCLCWRKHFPPKPWRLEVNNSSHAAVPNNLHGGAPASIKGTSWREEQWPSKGAQSLPGSWKAMRDVREVHKRNSGINSGRDAGLVSTRSSHVSELKGLFLKDIGEEKSKAWQMAGCPQALAVWRRGVSRWKLQKTGPVDFYYWEYFSSAHELLRDPSWPSLDWEEKTHADSCPQVLSKDFKEG